MSSGWKAAATRYLRRLPLPLVRPVIQRRVRRAQGNDVTRGIARRQMEFLLGRSRPDVDLDAVAERYLEQWVWRRELRWRPDAATRQRVFGVENLTRARGTSGGLMLCFVHHGLYEGAFRPMVEAGAPPFTSVVHPSLVAPTVAEHAAAQLRLIHTGTAVVPADVGYAGLRAVVEDGTTLAIAVDLPGSTRVRFVGRDLLGASGGARIAFETGTPVVLMTAHPPTEHGFIQDVHLSEPLMPADHATAEDLLQAILDGLEPSVLAWPEAYDWPRPKFTVLDDQGEPVKHVPEPGEPEI